VAPSAGRVNVWVEAARPRTLPAAVAPVVVGTAAADRLIAWRAAVALVVALSLQVAVNYANDLSDGVRGIDSPARVGPRRAVASRLVAPRSMMIAVAAALALASLGGLLLAAAVGPELVLVGAASIVAALAYSGGPRPYASAGLGELFVFVFFGLVATAGSAYVQDDVLSPLALAAAVPVGFLASAILVVNNLRDLDGDRASGKRTLAVRLGRARTEFMLRALISAAFAGTVVVALVAGSPWPLLGLAALPLARAALRSGPAALAATARLELIYACLVAAGLWLS
jgi:1,4-dihydroxy-2-naphthoate octaprenyltransferase